MTQAQSTRRSESISLHRTFPSAIAGAISPIDRSIAGYQSGCHIKVPHYLTAHYWWAYVHPSAVWVFERQWLVNLILWGNYTRLRNAAMVELGETLPGATLQVACVYGDLTGKLIDRVAAGGGRLDIVDVLPTQLDNLRSKLPPCAPARLLAMDSAHLKDSGRQLRSGAAVLSVARTAKALSRANAERSLPRGQTGRQDSHCRLCVAAVVASASLFVAALARHARAFRAGSMAPRNHPLAACRRARRMAQTVLLRRALSESRHQALRRPREWQGWE